MKSILITVFITILGILSCEEMPNQLTESFYGKWKLNNVSGGFTGKGHDLNFDYLVIEEELEYRFIKNDTILEFGKIQVINENVDNPLINFNPDEESKTFMGDSEKYIMMDAEGNLNLNSPCCDRFNYHFIKE